MLSKLAKGLEGDEQRAACRAYLESEYARRVGVLRERVRSEADEVARLFCASDNCEVDRRLGRLSPAEAALVVHRVGEVLMPSTREVWWSAMEARAAFETEPKR